MRPWKKQGFAYQVCHIKDVHSSGHISKHLLWEISILWCTMDALNENYLSCGARIGLNVMVHRVRQKYPGRLSKEYAGRVRTAQG